MWPRSDVNIVACDKNSLYKFNMKCSGNVHVNFSSYGDFFFAAADKIPEHILERCYTVQLDCYFFPVAYLYRHSIELKLKAIAFKNNSGAGEHLHWHVLGFFAKLWFVQHRNKYKINI